MAERGSREPKSRRRGLFGFGRRSASAEHHPGDPDSAGVAAAHDATLAALRAAAAPRGPQTSVVKIAFPTIPHYVDRHGAQAATELLLSAAQVIGSTIRSTDYSFQSEDYVFEVVLNNCGPDDANVVAVRIRMALEMAELAPVEELPISTRVITTAATPSAAVAR